MGSKKPDLEEGATARGKEVGTDYLKGSFPHKTFHCSIISFIHILEGRKKTFWTWMENVSLFPPLVSHVVSVVLIELPVTILCT